MDVNRRPNRAARIRKRCVIGATPGSERFRAKRVPVRVKKTRQNKKLEHDPEKWEPVFRKDHAQTKR